MRKAGMRFRVAKKLLQKYTQNTDAGVNQNVKTHYDNSAYGRRNKVFGRSAVKTFDHAQQIQSMQNIANEGERGNV
jgi:hypothetical protein